MACEVALSVAFALQGERTDATRVLHEAETLVERDPGELSRRDVELVAAFLALKHPEPLEVRRLLARALNAPPVASQAPSCGGHARCREPYVSPLALRSTFN
jgi:hypothetical protein